MNIIWCICDDGYTEYDGECYYNDDLSFLSAVVDLNDIDVELLYEINLTIWQNGRINTLLLEGLAIHEVPENIQNLDSLIHLSFSDNELEYLPESIGNLPSLNSLFLSNNLLVEIPETIGNLNNLEFFHMPGNQLTGFPLSISNLSNLISLNIDNNYFTTFPSDLLDLNNLRYVYIANNVINNLPSNINTISTLQILSAYSNDISILPSSIGELTNLYHFDVANNVVSEIPETICNIYENLTVFNIGLNYICPPYPICLDEEDIGEQNTSNCSTCFPGYTDINGTCYFQSDLDVLQEFINNSQSGVNPPLYNMSPIELGEQEWVNGRLVEFKCSTIYPTYLNYELSGEIPDGLSGLNELTTLFINANELTNIPNDIGNLSNLILLELSGNNFSSIPGSIGNLYNLEWLYIYNNQITYLPESLCNILDNLYSISMEYNLLCTGTYPDCIEEYLSVQDTSNCYEVCEAFSITDIQMMANAEFGNQLIINIEIPEIELYAPDFILQTDDEYLSVTDPVYSFFFVTGPMIVDLHYNYEYEYVPNNHLFSGNINLVSGDNILTCNLPFNEIIEIGFTGDLNNDDTVNILDIVLLVDCILTFDCNESFDLNGDNSLNILDIVQLVNIVLNP